MIAHARETKDEKRVILAAYLNPFKTEPERNLKGSTAQLAMATIFASGGYHLLLGEEGSVLTEAYYPDNCRIGEHSFRKTLKKYYDFITPFGSGGQPFQIYYLNRLLPGPYINQCLVYRLC